MKKRILSLPLALLLLLPLLTACDTKEKSNSTDVGVKTMEFSYWQSVGESSQYYTLYEDNPVIQYIMNHKTFKDKDGVETRIKLTFQVPASGKEVDTYNTMISTDSYLDVMDMNFGMPIDDMYAAGQILDLTYYVENYMPNYKAFLNKHPELVQYATNTVNGEKRYLYIPGASDSMDIYGQFCGVCYRRDWIVKYGTPPTEVWSLDANNQKVYVPNPKANEPFAFHYTLDKNGKAIQTTELTENVDPDSWVDNVVFPSGNTDPIYISDWEWMLDIFAKAIQAQGIDDGYVMSLYYPGYIQTGDISCAFGGGGPLFYRDRETGKAMLGAAGEGFKTYMECMHKWYQSGWIDKDFQDKTDMFFQIDETKIYQGKIGLWMGAAAHVGGRIASEKQPLTQGAMVFGAPQPINDLYGSDAVKFKEPYTMFQGDGLIGGGICVTNKAKDKDITVLLGFIDYLYSEEGSILKTMGLSKAQVEESQSPVYKQFGLTEGAYTVAADGKLKMVPLMEKDEGNFRSAMTTRLPGLTRNSLIQYSYAPTYVHSREQWMRYPATGFFGGMFNSQMSADGARLREQVTTVLEREYMHIEVPKFIVGEKNFEGDYEKFLNNLEKRKYKQVLDVLNETIEKLK